MPIDIHYIIPYLCGVVWLKGYISLHLVNNKKIFIMSKKNKGAVITDLTVLSNVIISDAPVNDAPIFDPETYQDVKGIELPEHEKSQVINQLDKLVVMTIHELDIEHESVLLKYRSVGESFMKLREYIENCKTSLGFTSFKGWYGDQKLSHRSVGYSQATKYITIAANFENAKIAYGKGAWSLSALASETNLLSGKAKTVDPDKETKKAPAKKETVSAGDVSDSLDNVSGVTSLEAVLAFIAQADFETCELLMDAIDAQRIATGELSRIGI